MFGLSEQVELREMQYNYRSYYQCNNCSKRFKSETWADKHTARKNAEGKRDCPDGMSYILPLRIAK